MGTKPDASTQELPAANTELSAAATRPMPPVPPSSGDARPPAPMVVGPQGDSCPSCGATMAADQRYCVECGNRRGEPRLPVMDGRTAAEAQPVAAPPGGYPPPPVETRSKWSSSVALIAGIGVLLLAMGVGVLIGHNGNSKNATAQQPVIIGGAATASTGTTAATGASAATAASSSKAATAASSSSGGDVNKTAKANGVKLAPDNVNVGGKCPKGSAGCTGTTFTGNFFK